MFPLKCSTEELGEFIEGLKCFADGWIGFYWGKTIEEYDQEEPKSIDGTIISSWLKYFREACATIR